MTALGRADAGASHSILELDEHRDREQALEDKVSSVQALLDEGA